MRTFGFVKRLELYQITGIQFHENRICDCDYPSPLAFIALRYATATASNFR